MNCVSTIQDRNLKYQIVSVYTLLCDVRISNPKTRDDIKTD
ncbi:MAG: hypothetical protein V7K68_21785 [Nostoc sp.]